MKFTNAEIISILISIVAIIISISRLIPNFRLYISLRKEEQMIEAELKKIDSSI